MRSSISEQKYSICIVPAIIKNNTSVDGNFLDSDLSRS